MHDSPRDTAEHLRLSEDRLREKNWKRWGPYLSERQWGTVREDYSEHGTCWDYFPHDHARSRAYRWGEDGLLGISDRESRICFALALWNGQDDCLKERLFGLAGPEGNHGEDVKEEYYYLDSTPTHSYCKALYKYPFAEYPYKKLVDENRSRGKEAEEFELADARVFDDDCYFDVQAEYAKASPDDILIRITIANRGYSSASIDLLPTIWFRNTWTWGCEHEGCSVKPHLTTESPTRLSLDHEQLEKFVFDIESTDDPAFKGFLFTDNVTNHERFGTGRNASKHVKDAFHDHIVGAKKGAVNPKPHGTKAAPHYRLSIPVAGKVVVKLRLTMATEAKETPFADFDEVFGKRIAEADEFYAAIMPDGLPAEETNIARQAYAGLLWTKQFYHYIVADWQRGDPNMPAPPPNREKVRNSDWKHFYSRDIISMPDKWEYPWFAAWDLAFHMVPFARLDPEFTKHQLVLFLREWYMHPNGQIPAYEFAFGDVNPPVHAWAAWRVYKMTERAGNRDRHFLESVFQKLLINFTWWVNQKDPHGQNIFAGGFLGLDNIGVFDRSKPLPTGGVLNQADGTAWMAFYCATMLSMALELAYNDGDINTAYEDMASKFLEHFIQIIDAINAHGGTGLWDEEDGFYYDQIQFENRVEILKTRSLVGLLPLIAVEVLESKQLKSLPGFRKRTEWFLRYRKDLSRHISTDEETGRILLAIPSRERLERVLTYLVDEAEFLSQYGIRSLSKHHEEHPYVLESGGGLYEVSYAPGESNTWLFGGNSNWRGPIWFPVNYLIIEALERYHRFYGDDLKVEFPSGSGSMLNLKQVASEISKRLVAIFLPDDKGRRPFAGNDARYRTNRGWNRLTLFHEYFHGDNGKGLGASHQTGWTALIAKLIQDLAREK